MVKLPPVSAPAQAESVWKVFVPVELDETVMACPLPPAFTAFAKASRSCTVITCAAPPQTPAVKLRTAVVQASWLAAAGTTVWVCGVGVVSGTAWSGRRTAAVAASLAIGRIMSSGGSETDLRGTGLRVLVVNVDA